MQEDNTGNRFRIGQNIFLVLSGGGVVVIFEHFWPGLLLILFGAVGFVHSVWRPEMKPASSIIWAFALVLTWAAIGYDVYDRWHGHQNPPPSKNVAAPVLTPNDAIIERGATGPNLLYVKVNNKLLGQSQKDFQLMLVVRLLDISIPNLSDSRIEKSAVYPVDPLSDIQTISVEDSLHFVQNGFSPSSELEFYLITIPVATESKITKLAAVEGVGGKILSKRSWLPTYIPHSSTYPGHP